MSTRDDFDLAPHLALAPDRLPIRPPPRKIRGWRRRSRELDRWAEQASHDPVPRLEAYGDHDVAIRWDVWGTDGWFPLAFRRRAVEQLVRIHDAWLPHIAALGDDAYLGIVLRLPHVYDSRVIAATGHRRDDLVARHESAGAGLAPAAPPSLYHRKPCDLSRFEWVHGVWADHDPLSAFDESDWPAVMRDAARVTREPDEEVVVTTVFHAYYGRLRREG